MERMITIINRVNKITYIIEIIYRKYYKQFNLNRFLKI